MNLSNKMRTLLRRIVLLVYPFFLGWYPILALRNHNISYVDLATILRSLIIVTAGIGIISLVTGIVLRNLEVQSIITGMIGV